MTRVDDPTENREDFGLGAAARPGLRCEGSDHRDLDARRGRFEDDASDSVEPWGSLTTDLQDTASSGSTGRGLGGGVLGVGGRLRARAAGTVGLRGFGGIWITGCLGRAWGMRRPAANMRTLYNGD